MRRYGWRRRDVLGAGASLLGLTVLAGCAPRLQPGGPDPWGHAPWLIKAPMRGGVSSESRLGPDRIDHAVMRDGTRLPLRRWQRGPLPPKAVVIALHGFNDYGAAFDEFGPYLANRGIAVWAPDQRGFGQTAYRGLWAGTRRMTDDLRDLVTLARQTHPETPVLVLGESMGGAVVLAALGDADDPLQADGAILCAPAVWGEGGQPLVARVVMPLVSHTIPWMTFTGEDLDIWPSDNIDWLRRLSRDPLTIKETRVDAIAGLFDLMDAAHAALPRIPSPVLMMLGANDRLIPSEISLSALRTLVGDGKNPLRRPAVYRDGWHMLLRDLDAVLPLEDIVSWVTAPRAPLPSEADRLARAVLSGAVTLSPKQRPSRPAY